MAAGVGVGVGGAVSSRPMAKGASGSRRFLLLLRPLGVQSASMSNSGTAELDTTCESIFF